MLLAEKIHKTYQMPAKPVHVLRGIDLLVESGSVTAIVGPSGAGKSTLLHILGGLDKPNEGRVEIDGLDLYRAGEKARNRERNRNIGFIFQFYHLLPEFSAFENVVLPGLLDRRENAKEVKTRAGELLKLVGLDSRRQHRPYELSGGEQQRVAIARALVNQPKIVFCDEPTGNLDSENGAMIIDLLLKLNRENNQTIVIVTHDKDIAAKAHNVLTMKDGLMFAANEGET